MDPSMTIGLLTGIAPGLDFSSLILSPYECLFLRDSTLIFTGLSSKKTIQMCPPLLENRLLALVLLIQTFLIFFLPPHAFLDKIYDPWCSFLNALQISTTKNKYMRIVSPWSWYGCTNCFHIIKFMKFNGGLFWLSVDVLICKWFFQEIILTYSRMLKLFLWHLNQIDKCLSSLTLLLFLHGFRFLFYFAHINTVLHFISIGTRSGYKRLNMFVHERRLMSTSSLELFLSGSILPVAELTTEDLLFDVNVEGWSEVLTDIELWIIGYGFVMRG